MTALRTGWGSRLSGAIGAILLFEILSGAAVTAGLFHPAVEWGLLLHTALGAAALLPLAWYCAAHWLDYREQAWSDVVLLGYLGAAALLICCLSGAVVTCQALFGIRTAPAWRITHLASTIAVLGIAAVHMALASFRPRQPSSSGTAAGFAVRTIGWTAAGLVAVAALGALYPGTRYVNQFPKGYSYLYGKNRPFAPSLARTASGGAFDARSLAGSESCGTSGCHDQILAEWQPSAHRYAAMDKLFQAIQGVMAKQNGPESTRYCGGCHDPISLFSGTKNIGVQNLTALDGYNEGISCLACHSIQKTDIQGNANYTMAQPRDYLWQWSTRGPRRVARDFLIRAFPGEHNRLSRRMFKSPEFCAACHKQFIDQEVNRVGWVQLQNQYDNWKASHWNHKRDAAHTVECRECHMPLETSHDPAAGDAMDYNRRPDDGKHRSHRFLASNNMMPAMLHLQGWQEQVRLTEAWLRGDVPVPEIQSKWSTGPAVRVRIETPASVKPGEKLPIRLVLTSNKVGHDYPTGPLDIIQSWVDLRVTDGRGQVVFATGRLNGKNFIEPGSFLFKAEPVDQYGNLIDRHNLWEMVGVRYRRSLFPGYSDTVEFDPAAPETSGPLRITALLRYRKVDQFLLNYVFGDTAGVQAPPVDLAEAEATVAVAR